MSMANTSTLLEVIRSAEGRENVVGLQNDEARTALKSLQEKLDTPSSDHVSRQAIIKVMIELAKRSGQFPPTFWLSDVSQGECVGGGRFGDIYQGFWNNENKLVPVALKISRGRPDPQKEKEICQEALLWRQLSHTNILPFHGLYQNEPAGAIMMVSQWMKNGNISNYLENKPNADRYQLLIHATEGLAYLHQQKPCVFHSDLKPENILIDDGGKAVLADFGSARVQHDLPDLLSSTQNNGTVVYTSPELLSNGKSTKSSDVWALGMVIYQVFTGKPPYFERFAFNKILASPPELPEKPTEDAINTGFTDELWDFLEKNCWAQLPRERPTARDCRKKLKDIRSRSLASL